MKAPNWVMETILPGVGLLSSIFLGKGAVATGQSASRFSTIPSGFFRNRLVI
jgi:hypothetical protein